MIKYQAAGIFSRVPTRWEELNCVIFSIMGLFREIGLFGLL